MNTLSEIYRPRTWDEVIAQDKCVNLLKSFESRGRLGGRGYFLSGKSGIGKSTIASIIAHKLADDMNIYEFNASDVTPATVREWTENQYYTPMGELQGRVYILEESHGLRKDTIRALLIFLENLKDTTVIFTTTIDGLLSFEDTNIDSKPLVDRCCDLPLSGTGLAKAFAQRAFEIAEHEGLGGKDFSAFLKLTNNKQSSMRAVLQAIEKGDMME